MARATYMILNVTGDLVTIADLNGRVSVTNDADAVVQEVLAKHPGKRIHYYDSMGDLDELVHDGRQFMGYAPVQGAPRNRSGL